jgi:protein kinase-like protein
MARVYLARDLLLNRDVAVKKLNPELSAALGQERFLREIEILTHLNHPHILPLLDKGEADGQLCYVMPYIAGESLRHRLRRETQLPIPEAIAITRDVAGALDYAHRQGVVHRDIKPENILMSQGLAIVADFGIARAIRLAAGDDDRITQTGVSPGTPPYMSPEQASSGDVDGRSDIYALGCVLYELLAGQPPFMGPTTQAILARHLADPVPPLRTVRKTVSVGLEQVVLKALEKVPADRFATAAEFAHALTAHTAHEHGDWRLPTAIGAAAAAVGIVVWFASRGGSASAGGSSPDSTRYAILPSERDSGVASLNEDQLLQDAMLRWTGVSVVDRPNMQEALTGFGARLTSSDAEAVARRVGAGRYVRTQASRVGDSLRIHAAVYSSAIARGPPIHESTVKIGFHPTQTGAAFVLLADQLLFDESGPGVRLDEPSGTTSRPARQAFEDGLDSVYTWNLPAADSAFNAATHYDPEYSTGLLWLGLVRSWMGARVATWQSAAERAAARRQRLSARDRLMSDALVARVGGDVSRACRTWHLMTMSAPNDFAAWYGFAVCLATDSAVVRDPSSPSGWNFRTSYHGALVAYERAFSLLPSMLRSFREGSYEYLLALFKISGNQRRPGHAVAPDTMTFGAVGEWRGDSLAFVPYPKQRTMLQMTTRPGARESAVRQLRLRFHHVALTWATAEPLSADAMEALAISLQLLGDITALDTLRRARALVRSAAEDQRVARSQVWMELSFALPSDEHAIHHAVSLADSLLRQLPPGNPDNPLDLAALAALTGRADLAASYCRDARAEEEMVVPGPLRGSALPLLAYAALGGPLDTLRTLERRVAVAIASGLPPERREAAKLYWLGRPATLAFPVFRFDSMRDLAGKGDWLLDLQAAWIDGDTSVVLKGLDVVRAARREILPANLTMDGLYPEAALLGALGKPEDAMAWLKPTLDALPQVAPQILEMPEQAASLVQAARLRATLAARLGDHAEAARWAKAVIILWANADQYLQPLVQDLRRVTR